MVLVSIWLSIDSEAATEITLAGLKQLFCFCSALQKAKGYFNPARVISVASSLTKPEEIHHDVIFK